VSLNRRVVYCKVMDTENELKTSSVEYS